METLLKYSTIVQYITPDITNSGIILEYYFEPYVMYTLDGPLKMKKYQYKLKTSENKQLTELITWYKKGAMSVLSLFFKKDTIMAALLLHFFFQNFEKIVCIFRELFLVCENVLKIKITS